ncbi:MAG TPA: hypothetical protein VM146_19465 [Steroidobacteraceae bacterium]|nr:hypothetical protein [Steroidobacteraceae bacterium]
MNTKLSATFALTALGLLSCSTSPRPAAVATPVAQTGPLPPMVIQKDLPLEPRLAMGRICKLGTSCLEMDSRPFEVCLVGAAKHCVDKGVEIIPAQGQESAAPEGPVTVGRR